MSPPNPVTVALYATGAAGAQKPALGSVSGLPAATHGLTLTAGPTDYTVQSPDFPSTLILAPNGAAAACRDR